MLSSKFTRHVSSLDDKLKITWLYRDFREVFRDKRLKYLLLLASSPGCLRGAERFLAKNPSLLLYLNLPETAIELSEFVTTTGRHGYLFSVSRFTNKRDIGSSSSGNRESLSDPSALTVCGKRSL